MARKVVTAQQAYELLYKLVVDGKGHLPLRLQECHSGIPSCSDVWLFKEAEPYDGEFVAIFISEQREPPKWLDVARGAVRRG